MAMAAYKAIGCQGYARVDMRQDERGVLNVIEVNPNPDISPVAGTTRQAEAAGMSYQDFIQKIILAGFKRGGS
jgi:D-alanine-D-alanine ligase